MGTLGLKIEENILNNLPIVAPAVRFPPVPASVLFGPTVGGPCAFGFWSDFDSAARKALVVVHGLGLSQVAGIGNLLHKARVLAHVFHLIRLGIIADFGRITIEIRDSRVRDRVEAQLDFAFSTLQCVTKI